MVAVLSNPVCSARYLAPAANTKVSRPQDTPTLSPLFGLTTYTSLQSQSCRGQKPFADNEICFAKEACRASSNLARSPQGELGLPPTTSLACN
mmetsp:Transcript_22813/g.40382  ORF Transcript_22813/g.40382 Transcript_22813/m.40382 type:complete len:93 (-) Transcript_22813:12-290(-)